MSKEIFTVYSKEPNAMFDHVVLEKCIKKAITSSSMKLDPDCELEDENMPKTFVVSTYLDGTGTTAVRMRAFGTLTDDPFEAKVWEAARATSAAPTFFQPMVIDGIRYGDGGTGWNNPTEEAIDEAHIIWPKRPIGCLISIGTGLEDPLQLRDQSGKVSDSFLRSLFRTAAPKQDFKLRVAEFCVQCLTSCEKVHEKIDSNPTRYGLDSSYYRLNVPQGMSKIGLEEWDKLSEMKSLTKSYMDSGYIRRTKQTISKLLLNPQSAGKAREKDRQGRTTLHRAALRGDVQEIETQWDQGADIDALEDQKGWTPLICSIEQNHPEAFKTLLAIGADPNKPDSIPWTPLHHSLSGPKDPIFAWTLINEPRIEVDKRDNAGRTPLFHAVVGGQAAFISLLVSKGADVNARDNEGRIALHFASLLQNLEVLEELLKSRTDINIKDNYGRTPLHWATMRNDPTTVAWLLQKGADPQLQDLENQTPLQYAEKNNITACIPLLQAPNGRPSESQNPDTLAQLVQGLQVSESDGKPNIC
jgi:ankyrin repeat protein